MSRKHISKVVKGLQSYGPSNFKDDPIIQDSKAWGLSSLRVPSLGVPESRCPQSSRSSSPEVLRPLKRLRPLATAFFKPCKDFLFKTSKARAHGLKPSLQSCLFSALHPLLNIITKEVQMWKLNNAYLVLSLPKKDPIQPFYYNQVSQSISSKFHRQMAKLISQLILNFSNPPVLPLRDISGAINLNKTWFWTQCDTCWPIYVLNGTIFSSPYQVIWVSNCLIIHSEMAPGLC